MVFAFVLAIAMNMGSWWFSDKIALRMSGAQEVSPQEAPDLYRLVQELSTRANLPTPRVAIINSPMPNAFATGRSPEKGVVAVTTGIMQILDRDELGGVIAHELAHIKNRDTLISSVAATVAGAISMLANIAQWGLIFGGLGGGDDDDNPGGLIGALLTIIVAPIAAAIIQMAISRSREYAADASGANILGNPLPLASALEKLERGVARTPAHVNPGTSHQYIVNPLKGGIAGMFSTHPPTQERISRLRSMVGKTALAG
jgi:heat shock protein HtpX